MSPSPRADTAPPPKFDFSQLDQERAREGGDHSGKMDPYRDPVDGRVYLAAWAEVHDPAIGWVALVQHDREAALQPIRALRGDLRDIALTLSASAAVLTTGLWAWLFWMLRRTQRIADG